MKKEENKRKMKVAFPHMGTISIAWAAALKKMGIEPFIPPYTSKKTLSLGTKNSPEAICLPYKLILGNFIEAIEGGTDYVAMITSPGICRLGEYGKSIKNVLTKLYNNEIPSSAPFYDRSGRGWMQFCVAYRQYGVQQKLTDPIKGLSYFSAFETTESLPSDPTYVEVAKGTGQFIFEDGKYIDVEGSTRESEGNYNLTEYVNKVHFDRIIMPLGYIYKFVPEKTGVYNIHGIDC